MTTEAIISEARLAEALPHAIRRETRVMRVRGITRVAVPIPDAFGDYVQVALLPCDGSSDQLLVSDLGRTYCDLVSVSGPVKRGSEREGLFVGAARNHGVGVQEGRLEVACTPALLGEAILAVAGAVVEAQQLIHLNKQVITRLFQDEVRVWLSASHVDATQDYAVSGRSPAAHTVDFVVLRDTPVYIETISNENKMRGALLTFYDLVGTHDFLPIAIIDDEEAYTNRTFQQLAYIVPHVYPWSRKDEMLELLVA
jgi:hypothetical protein